MAQLVTSVSMDIGGVDVDRHYSDFWEVWDALNRSPLIWTPLSLKDLAAMRIAAEIDDDESEWNMPDDLWALVNEHR